MKQGNDKTEYANKSWFSRLIYNINIDNDFWIENIWQPFIVNCKTASWGSKFYDISEFVLLIHSFDDCHQHIEVKRKLNLLDQK